MDLSFQDVQVRYNGSVYELDELEEYVDKHLENIETALKSNKEKEKVATALRADVVKFKKDFEAVITFRIATVIEESFSEYVRDCPIRKCLLSHKDTRASAEDAFLQDLDFSRDFTPVYLKILENVLLRFDEGLAVDFYERMIGQKDSATSTATLGHLNGVLNSDKSNGISPPIFHQASKNSDPSPPAGKVLTFQEKSVQIDAEFDLMFGPSVYL